MKYNAQRRGDYNVTRFSLRMGRSTGVTLRKAIRQAAEAVHFPDEALQPLLIGATEACSNALKHGVAPSPGNIEASILSKSDEIIVRLLYKGEPFVFANAVGIETEEPAAPGRGHYLMLRTLDEVHYQFRGGRTLVRLVKRSR